MALREQLRAFFGEAKGRRVVLVGIGNPIKRDDAIGLRVLDLLQNRGLKDVLLLKTEVVPESYTGVIRDFNPTHVLMLDAAHFKGEPGETRVIPLQIIANVTISTHSLPLSIFAEFIQKSVCGNIILLGIQCVDINFGEGLTPQIEKSAEKIANTLAELL